MRFPLRFAIAVSHVRDNFCQMHVQLLQLICRPPRHVRDVLLMWRLICTGVFTLTTDTCKNALQIRIVGEFSKTCWWLRRNSAGTVTGVGGQTANLRIPGMRDMQQRESSHGSVLKGKVRPKYKLRTMGSFRAPKLGGVWPISPGIPRKSRLRKLKTTLICI